MSSFEQTDFFGQGSGSHSASPEVSSSVSKAPESPVTASEFHKKKLEEDIDENCPICGGSGPCVRCARGRRLAEEERKRFKRTY